MITKPIVETTDIQNIRLHEIRGFDREFKYIIMKQDDDIIEFNIEQVRQIAKIFNEMEN